MRVVFMGTPDFAVPTLEKIKNSGHEISLVVTQEDKQRGRGKKLQHTPVKEKALELGIEVYQPAKVNDDESVEKIREASPDVIVVVAYGQILSEEILYMPKHKCLNVHASILPKYRGPAPLNWAVINGESESGVTIMEMAKGLDTGDMIKISKVKINEEMTAGELHDALMDTGAEALVEVLSELETGEISKTPQDHSASSYAPMMSKELGHIDWNKSSKDIKNLVRGTQPWPGAYFYMDEKMVKIRNVRVEDMASDAKAGEIVKVDSTGIYVKTFDGVVAFEELQVPGKRWMNVEEYLRGNNVNTGVVVL